MCVCAEYYVAMYSYVSGEQTINERDVTRVVCVCVCAEYYVAMHTYVSGEQADLSFNEGDMLVVTKKDDDWWTGTLGEKTGIFPSSYVKKVEIQVSAPRPPRSPASLRAVKQVRDA